MAGALARRSSPFAAPKVKYRTRVVKAARRGAGRAAVAAREEKHTLAALAAAAAIGYAERTGTKLPTLGPLDAKATTGLVLWAIGRFSKSKVIQHAATGVLSIAVYDMANGSGTSGDSGEMDFDPGE